jgi:Uma2 family endonuclease
MSDLRLWIPNCRLYTYPDVMVVHTPLVFAENRQDTIVNPLAIAEILSDSTEKYDRGDQFRMYRTIPSFKEYLLISQEAMQVEKFSKKPSNLTGN